MNCPHCGCGKYLRSNGELSVEIDVAEESNCENYGHFREYAKHWFEIEKFTCSQCGNSFWLQNEEV